MANSEIFIIPQQPSSTDRVVLLTDAQVRNGYQFDVVTRFSTQHTYRPTSHSIPSGTHITDHVVKEPVKFSLIGILTPYNVFSLIRVLNVFATETETASVRKTVGDQTASAVETVNRKRGQLQDLADKFTPLTIVGNNFQHANMVITSIADPKTPDLGDGYQVTVSFLQIKIAKQATQEAPLISKDLEKLGGIAAVLFDR